LKYFSKACLSLVSFSFFITLPSFSAQESPLTPITQLFDAMRTHDSKKLLAQFSDTAILARATKDNVLKSSSLEKFASSIEHAKSLLDEQIFNVTIKESGNLASVWTPFAFYLDKKLHHCGVNSFQLVKTNGHWKIVYLIDNAFEGDCQEFIALNTVK